MIKCPIEEKINYAHRSKASKIITYFTLQRQLEKQNPLIQLKKIVPNQQKDYVLETSKIVFQLQHDPISEEAAKERCARYERLGYEVVWILSDAVFNQQKGFPAEIWLRKHRTTYFSDGIMIYDQLDLFLPRQKVVFDEKFIVQLHAPFQPFLTIPGRKWSLHFLGDLHTWCCQNGINTVNAFYKTHRPSWLRTYVYPVWLKILALTAKN